MSRILAAVLVLALASPLACSLQASLRGSTVFADDPGAGSVTVADLPPDSGHVNDAIPTANVTLAPATAGESADNTTFHPSPNSDHLRNVSIPTPIAANPTANGSIAGIPAPAASMGNGSMHHCCGHEDAANESAVDEAGYQLYAIEVWLVHYTNLVRAKYGKPKQCVNVRLQNAARHSATVQAKCGVMEHHLCDGSTMTSRVKAQGFTYTSIAENVAYTTYCGRTAQECAYTFVRTWVQSPSHFQNMLRNLPMAGMSAAKSANGNYYATQVFGSSYSERCHIAVN